MQPQRSGPRTRGTPCALPDLRPLRGQHSSRARSGEGPARRRPAPSGPARGGSSDPRAGPRGPRRPHSSAGGRRAGRARREGPLRHRARAVAALAQRRRRRPESRGGGQVAGTGGVQCAPDRPGRDAVQPGEALHGGALAVCRDGLGRPLPAERRGAAQGLAGGRGLGHAFLGVGPGRTWPATPCRDRPRQSCGTKTPVRQGAYRSSADHRPVPRALAARSGPCRRGVSSRGVRERSSSSPTTVRPAA